MVLVPVNRTDARRRGDRAKAVTGERRDQSHNRERKAAWPTAGKEQSESLRQLIGVLLVYEAEDDELGVKV